MVAVPPNLAPASHSRESRARERFFRSRSRIAYQSEVRLISLLFHDIISLLLTFAILIAFIAE